MTHGEIAVPASAAVYLSAGLFSSLTASNTVFIGVVLELLSLLFKGKLRFAME